MNDFINTDAPIVRKEHSIFVEKYRPDSLDDYIAEKSFKEALASFIKKKDIPHLLFHSEIPGAGKTSAAKLLVKNIPCDHLYLNMSDVGGIETVRTKIKDFASTVGFQPLKIIIADEFDFSSLESQAALRNTLETFSLNTRFILTCNYIERVIPPIISRCQTFKVESPCKKDVAILLKSILDREKITFTVEDLGYIVNTYYPDMRKVINFAQQSIVDSKIVINKHNSSDTDTKAKLLGFLKKGNLNVFNEIRQLIADADTKFYDEYYRFLYDNVGEYAKGKDVLIVLEIAEKMYQSSLVIDREITFMSCIACILKHLNK